METHLDASTDRPFSGSAACRDGLLTKARLRGPSFVPLFPDTYVGSAAVVTPVVRREALQVWLGPEAVVGGSLAADAHGCPTVDDLVEVFVPPDRRPRRADVIVRRDRLFPFEIEQVDGVRVTSPERTAFDLARRLELVDGVAMADAFAYRHRVGPHRLLDLVARHPNVRGLDRVREAVAWMELDAASIPESRMRVLLVQRGVPSPVLQFRIAVEKHNGRLTVVAKPDLTWPQYRLAVQYDGPEHLERWRRMKDIDQDDTLRAAGWLVIRVMVRQLADPDALAERILRELRARGWRP